MAEIGESVGVVSSSSPEADIAGSLQQIHDKYSQFREFAHQRGLTEPGIWTVQPWFDVCKSQNALDFATIF
jgi:hypothetical protein